MSVGQVPLRVNYNKLFVNLLACTEVVFSARWQMLMN